MAGRRRRKRSKSLVEAKENGGDSSPEQPDDQETQTELPTELMEVIFNHLTLKENVIASAVCKKWQAIAVSIRNAEKSPILMFLPKHGDLLYEFYDPAKRKTYWLELPELRGSRICYAKDGWLLMCVLATDRVFFFSPYTRELIEMPDLDLTYQIAAFSASPKSPNCILFSVRHVSPTMVAVSTCRPGATSWDTVNYQNRQSFLSSIWTKVVFCNGVFYCLSLTGWLGVYSPEKSTWDVDVGPPPKCPVNFYVKYWWKGKFMAEHNGDVYTIYTGGGVNPMIYKLDEDSKKWAEVESLGCMTLFANFVSSVARTDLLGNMRNNIYFSKVRFFGKQCISYSLSDGRYYPRKQFYEWGEQEPFESVWIEPPEDLSTFL